ncbi:hypothetical protein [Bradyrhizobium sp. 139]|nr:hypothetical protein [Bradyrhizobium sp. 139]
MTSLDAIGWLFLGAMLAIFGTIRPRTAAAIFFVAAGVAAFKYQ